VISPKEWHDEMTRRLGACGPHYQPGTEAQRRVDKWLDQCPHEENGFCDCFLIIHCKHCYLAMREGTLAEIKRDQPDYYADLIWEQQHPWWRQFRTSMARQE
jgi:hypothetical protein